MTRKRTEGDNEQRRQRARQARREGVSPSEAQVTTGASRQREHLPHKAETEERQQSPERGKQRSDVDEGPSRR
ncbi:hypothetical protein [Haloactinomyces albus]|uniref:Uncharacterized protein n=1 Tax=Haloactinomyces albus TaxID=1352928 RepID=A0AAE3ZEV2_9ACTN|nr:hypothetical protein [Haloactinomyces albus]MDR7302595.1 hypothetical protein [Haloactinomyces albus]